MNIGLIGLENSGKTAIFNALTGSTAEVASYHSGKMEPNIAIVEVLDERIEKLTAMYQPKRTIHATIEFIDFVGLSEGSAQSGLFSGSAMNMIKTADALAVVLRNFHEETIDQVLGDPNPLGDIDSVASELILSDMIIVEKRLEKIATDIKKGKKTPELQAEEKVLQILIEKLNDGIPIRNVELKPDEEKSIHGFQFLTGKPLMAILNSDESNYGRNGSVIDGIKKTFPVIEFAGNFEMELSQLEPEDAEAFMQDMGITQSARSRLTPFAYDMLGYLSFFTVGEDEVRAWTLRKGENAVAAAGTIHTDLARGFIRAECFTYDDLMEFGSEKGIKEHGKHRLEGKTYLVQDGDILNIRFSV